MVVRFYLISIIIFLSASFNLSISVFSSRKLKLFGKVAVLLTISSLIGIFLLQKISPVSVSSGQNNKYITEITARVLADSKEISGGFNIFPVNLLSSCNMNSTTTGASGKLIFASKIITYKGQMIVVKKDRLLEKSDSIVFVDKKRISILDSEQTWYEKLLRERKTILKHLKKRINRMGTDSSILFTALFTGYKENPNSKLFLSFRHAGASHILALSGMHLGIISLGIMFLLKYIVGRKISFIVTFLVILFYVFLTGAGYSLTRAAIFFVLLGFFLLLGIRLDIFHLLIFCFFIQVINYPESSYNLSFQLSYLAISGIILLSEKINYKLPGIIPPVIRSVLSASIAAQIFTAPLVLYYFGVIYPVGIVSGIFLVPLVTIFIWMGIIVLLPLPLFMQKILFWIMDIIYMLIKSSADFFSQFPSLMLKPAIVLFVVVLTVLFFMEYSSDRYENNRKL